MSPQEARIIIVEDNPDILGFVSLVLEQAGHQVIGTATNHPEVKALVAQVASLMPNALIVDGTIDEKGVTTQGLAKGQQGKLIAQQFQEVLPYLPVFAFTSGSQVTWGDGGPSKDPNEVADWVTALPDKTE